ncbi:MAG: M61 family peptidase [Nevskiaceae bacterium]|nr:MAG: M61 family peptidase [Nevskiaceae bacterium]TBR72033.1 MAG: M61 family peptidase [Nevskiaceae bacterium]
MSMSSELCACHATAVGSVRHAGKGRERELATGVYPGELQLSVNLTAAPQRIFRIEETITGVAAGEVALHYPQWVPGEHAPSGPIEGVTGLEIRAGRRKLVWRRDPIDLFTLVVEVPKGATQLNLKFQFLSPGPGGSFGAAVSATPNYAVLAWNQVLFYPTGYRADAIPCCAAVTLPDGWQAATALEADAAAGAERRFKPVMLQHLVDSPLLTGRYFRRVQLDGDRTAPVHLNVVADAPRHLEWKDEQIAGHRRLIEEVRALFQSRHYRRYEFLLTLSDHTMHFGLEHQQSSDDRLDAEFFTDDQRFMTAAGLMPHELVHSWNGKFRCPAPTATPNYNVPMGGALMWVYEGLTTYWGDVLTARCRLWTPEQYRDVLAADAAAMASRPGGSWRPLQDTCDMAPRLYESPTAWANQRRATDFYPEGALLWLAVDARLRTLSADSRTLDDFCRKFHGMDDGATGVRPFEFEDVVAALEATVADDWAMWLRSWLDATALLRDPLSGLRAAGWKLAFRDTPSDYFKHRHAQRKLLNLNYSAGFVVNTKDGTLVDVQWQSPAFDAGLVPGMKLVAVDGEAFSEDALSAAIAASAKGVRTVDLLVENVACYGHHALRVKGGLRYPYLERDESVPDRLTQILEPLASLPKKKAKPGKAARKAAAAKS